MTRHGHVICAACEVTVILLLCFLQGITPLHNAATSGKVQHVQALLAHGADIHAQATIKLVKTVSPSLFCEQHLR